MQPGQLDVGIVGGEMPASCQKRRQRPEEASPVKAHDGRRRFTSARWLCCDLGRRGNTEEPGLDLAMNDRETTDVGGHSGELAACFPYVKTGTHPDVSGCKRQSVEVPPHARSRRSCRNPATHGRGTQDMWRCRIAKDRISFTQGRYPFTALALFGNCEGRIREHRSMPSRTI